jgi:hypothetical protein
VVFNGERNIREGGFAKLSLTGYEEVKLNEARQGNYKLAQSLTSGQRTLELSFGFPLAPNYGFNWSSM